MSCSQKSGSFCNMTESKKILDHWHYRIDGDSCNPAILFLHGFAGSGREWNSIVQQLAVDFFCITVDLPGHGLTRIRSGQDVYRMPACAAGLMEVLESLQQRICYLVGYSMGGRLALYLSLFYPEFFKRIVLVAASPGLEQEAERHERMTKDAQWIRLLEMSGMEEFLKAWYDQPLFHTLKTHPHFEELLSRRRENDPHELAKSLHNMGLGVQDSLWHHWQNNKIPALLVVGDLDDKYQSIAERMAHSCAVAQMAVIADCGHNVLYEKPDELTQVLKEFFSS